MIRTRTPGSILAVAMLFAASLLSVGAQSDQAAEFGEIRLKASTSGSTQALPGACYSISGFEFCDDDGDSLVIVTDVPVGEHVVTETVAPQGFEITPPFAIFVDPLFPEASDVSVSHRPIGGGGPFDYFFEVDSEEPRFFESPTWGFMIRWDALEFTAGAQTSIEGVDHLELHGTAGDVSYLGYRGFEGDPAACLASRVRQLQSDPSVTDMHPVVDAAGFGFEYSSVFLAENAYKIVFRDGRALAMMITCHQLVPGAAVLQVEISAPFEPLDDQSWWKLETVSRDIAFPRSTFQAPGPRYYYLVNPIPRDCAGSGGPNLGIPQLVYDTNGREVAFVAASSTWGNHASPPSIELVIENTGTAPLALDANRFRFFVRDPETRLLRGPITRTPFQWISAPGELANPIQTIEPGRRAIVALRFAYPMNVQGFEIREIHYEGGDSTRNPFAAFDYGDGCLGAGGGRGKPARSG